jgi:hypothetical protein
VSTLIGRGIRTRPGIPDAVVDLEAMAAQRHQARRGIRAIDKVLEAVEQHHLARLPRRMAPRPEWIRILEEEGGLSVPRDLLEVKTTVHLHGALLEWQDALLDIALPGRAQLVRADE